MLVVDDSAVVRLAMRELLGRMGMRVAVAADPVVARDVMRATRPDVLLLDLQMPRVDGLTFLRELRAEADAVPVVIFSGLVSEGDVLALRALEEGAIDVVAKPRLGVRAFLHDSAVLIADALRAAALARRRRSPRPVAFAPRPKAPLREAAGEPSRHVIGIGASTGGTDALPQILGELTPDMPGVVVVQHMPAGFTAAFAARLDSIAAVQVREARDGDPVVRGRVLVAPGDRHMSIVPSARGYAIRLSDGPLVSRHRPSVDVLFDSLARVAGPNAIGVVLTGMGNDGAAGLLALRRARGMTMAQDEATSLIYGMPRAAVECGAAAEIQPLDAIAARLRALAVRTR